MAEWTASSIEIVNPDTAAFTCAAAVAAEPGSSGTPAYPLRPAAAIASLIDESTNVLSRWDAMAPRRRVVGLAGVDAHAKLALKEVDPGDNRYSIALPSYESSFRTLSVHVHPERPLSGDAAADGRAVIAAIRAGHLYTALDGLASPPSFAFTASNQHSPPRRRSARRRGPVTLRVQQRAGRVRNRRLAGSRVLTSRKGEPDFTFGAPAEPAVYRIAVRALDRLRQPT